MWWEAIPSMAIIVGALTIGFEASRGFHLLFFGFVSISFLHNLSAHYLYIYRLLSIFFKYIFFYF